MLTTITLMAQVNIPPTSYGTGAGAQGGATSSYYGFKAGEISEGPENSFSGYFSGGANTTGKQNAFYGSRSGSNNTTGERNTFIGFRSGYDNTLANYNSFVGSFSGRFNTTGERNSFMGCTAGYQNTTGERNTALGFGAGFHTTVGSNNTFVGYNAGRNNITGTGNVFVGYQAGLSETGDNKLYIDNSNTTNPLIYGDFDANELTVNGRFNVPGGKVRFGDLTVTTPGNYLLYVQDGILTEKVKVANVNAADWADFVFADDYDRKSTKEVEEFIKTNKHLPNVPSAREVSENGVDMVEMDATLLRQIEELWLHVIELKKENEALKAKVEEK